jgi:GT2 family glycosyltransferase
VGTTNLAQRLLPPVTRGLLVGLPPGRVLDPTPGPAWSWLVRQAQRAERVIRWTLTLQLHTQFGYWLQARRRRAEPVPQPQPTLAPALIRFAVPAHIAVPRADAPAVSVIIPCYGQLEHTLACLASIAAHKPAAPIEVIVVDDASPAGSTTGLEQVDGIRLIVNPRNLGYLRSCNAAARIANGEFLLFLNNDTEVLPDWLDPMLALFRARPDVGAVGAKLVYPDGTLQEAGGIIWSDGSGWNYGRFGDPSAPAFNYVREVDYCSGAALLVPRAVFAALGGFDERYAPAYYEDTDLCFRLRQCGLKTLYQPRAAVIHVEGASHGTDLGAGGKAHQAINRERFLETWRDVLAAAHLRNGQHVLRACEQARHRRVVLVIDHYVPEPDRDAGSCCMVSLMRALQAEGMRVKFWPQNLRGTPGYTEALQQMGVEVFHGPHAPQFGGWIAEHGAELDCVVVSRPDIAEAFLPELRRHVAAPLLFYGHDLHFRRLALMAEQRGDSVLRREAAHMQARERAVWRQVDAVLYLSEEEAAIAASLEPGVVARAVQPYGFTDFAAPRPAVAGLDMVFVAGFAHPPNEDAAVWFVDSILPLIQARVPAARLAIVGSNPTLAVRELAGPAVSLHANVAEPVLLEFYRRARVAVVPLRCGAGVKLKVVESLREGVPLVTTPVGAQGLPGLSSVASVAADAESFAAAVIALLEDDALWQTRCAAQIDYARAHFSEVTLRRSLLEAAGFAADATRGA